MVIQDRNIRILLIEDSAPFAQSIQRILGSVEGGQFDVAWVDNLSAGLQRLNAGETDAILLDLSLPDSDGIDTFFRAQARVPGTPIIVLTSMDDESLAEDAIRGGAQDYLIKGKADGDLIGRAIRYAIERKRAEKEREILITELKKALTQVKKLSGLLPICFRAFCSTGRSNSRPSSLASDRQTRPSRSLPPWIRRTA